MTFTKEGPELPRLMNALDRTSLQVYSRSSSPQVSSTCSELYPEANTAQPGQRGTTRMHTRKTHARQRRHNTTASPRLQRGAGRRRCRAAAADAAAAAAAAAPAAAVLLLLHDPRRIAEHNLAQQTVVRFVPFGTHPRASNGTATAAPAPAVRAASVAAAAAQQQQQQEQQQGRPKNMYRHQAR